MQRKNTLLKEYERSGKASVFVDKRIGEDKEGMEEFEKAILRSQREYKVRDDVSALHFACPLLFTCLRLSSKS